MILFAIDTSGKNGRLGIARRIDGRIDICATGSLNGGQYSAELIPTFAAMLGQVGLRKTEVDAIAVVAGPGSFTGLRVGLAAAKGLAEVLQKPLTAISALEMVAAASKRGHETVVAAVDAGRGDVFLGHCEIHPKFEIRTRSEVLAKQTEMVARVREFNAAIVTSDEKIMAIASQAGLEYERIAPPGVDVLAAMAYSQFDRGVTMRPDDLDANYLRRSDAEVLFSPSL
jgi:tRNA threonylcarbamoyladenosine biosynthesis protein TsaB